MPPGANHTGPGVKGTVLIVSGRYIEAMELRHLLASGDYHMAGIVVFNTDWLWTRAIDLSGELSTLCLKLSLLLGSAFNDLDDDAPHVTA